MLLNPVGFFYNAGIGTLKLVASNRSSSAALVLPMNIQAGDLLIHYNQTENQSAAAASTPSGFTSISAFAPASWVIAPNPEGYAFKARLSYKIATGTEGGTTITGMSPNTFRSITEHFILVYRGNMPVTGVTKVSWATATSTSSSSAPTRNLTITPSHAPLMAICIYAADNTVSEGTITFSPAASDSVSGLSNSVKYRCRQAKIEDEVSNISIAYRQTGSGAGGSGGGTLNKMIMSGYLRITGE
jgi:hypothetical protein